MANERGTMQRGLAPGDQQGWAEPTAPAGRRLPTPQRERKPALAALALLLIVGGALGAGLLVARSGQRVAAIEVTRQIGAGQKIPGSALQQVEVAADSGVGYVAWAYAGNVAQDYAATMIPAGTLLSRAMVAPAGATLTGREVLGLALKDGQWPPQLTAGDHVAVYATSSQAGNGTGTGCRRGGGLTLADDARVVAVAAAGASGLLASGQSGSADVTVAVSPADAGVVACYAAAGQVAVALLPPGSQAPPPSQRAAGPPAAGSGGHSSPGSSRKPSASRSPGARPGHG